MPHTLTMSRTSKEYDKPKCYGCNVLFGGIYRPTHTDSDRHTYCQACTKEMLDPRFGPSTRCGGCGDTFWRQITDTQYRSRGNFCDVCMAKARDATEARKNSARPEAKDYKWYTDGMTIPSLGDNAYNDDNTQEDN